MRPNQRRDIVTSHGVIAIEESGGSGISVLFIHGNSTCRGVFRKQFQSAAAQTYHFVALDLPGHGDSSDAVDAGRTYSRPGLADVCLEVLEILKIERVALVGWSLGGHVAIEMLSRSKLIRGLMAIGTPPVGNNMAEGFLGKPLGGLASQSELTHEQAEKFVGGIFGDLSEAFILQAVERTDLSFRGTLFDSARRGEGANQRDVVSSTHVPTAMVNGARDSIVNLDFVDTVSYGNLWGGECFRMAQCAHSPFWQQPTLFNALLSRFLDDIANK